MAGSGPGIAKKARQGGLAGLIVTAVAGIGTSGVQYAENSHLQETILAMHKENSAMAIECFSHLSDRDLEEVNVALAPARAPAHAHAPEGE